MGTEIQIILKVSSYYFKTPPEAASEHKSNLCSLDEKVPSDPIYLS